MFIGLGITFGSAGITIGGGGGASGEDDDFAAWFLLIF